MKQVTVVWGSKKYQLELDETAPVIQFLQLLYQVTNVPVEKQKLLLKHKQIKSDSVWNQNEIKDGLKFMLLGSADEAVQVINQPKEEELPVNKEKSKIEEAIFIGLKNYENTCYLNSVLEVFRYLPEFQKIILHTPLPSNFRTGLVPIIVSFYKNFPRGLDTLVGSIRYYNPTFREKDPITDTYMQQDAAECWTFLLKELSKAFPEISNLFNIKFKSTYTNNENPDEKEIKTEISDKLQVNIDSETSYIEKGIEMNSEVTKFSKLSGKDCIFTVHKEILELPKYLIIQMMRFCYKNDEKIVAKIVKRIKISHRLNVYSWVAHELEEKLINPNDVDEDPKTLREKGKESSKYDLLAILTHRGRTANSGHYVSHVRIDDQWYRYDDEKVKEIDTDAIDDLSGGADWHCSYILVYERQSI